MTDEITVRLGTIDEAFAIAAQLPEFQPWIPKQDAKDRLKAKHIVLIAEVDQPVGFKMGYYNATDGSFYSWLGGVLPSFRNMGIAKSLLVEMEHFARQIGCSYLTMKTLNRHKGMLIFALKADFLITGFEQSNKLGESKIKLRKSLYS